MSARTIVAHHRREVFVKVGIANRGQLARALGEQADDQAKSEALLVSVA